MIPIGNRLGFLALDLDFRGWILGLGSKGGMYYVYSAYCAGFGRIHGTAIYEVILHTLLGLLMISDLIKMRIRWCCYCISFHFKPHIFLYLYQVEHKLHDCSSSPSKAPQHVHLPSQRD
jgi:hypothetical protein